MKTLARVIWVTDDSDVSVVPHPDGDLVTEVGHDLESGEQVVIARTPAGAELTSTKYATAVHSEVVAAEANRRRRR